MTFGTLGTHPHISMGGQMLNRVRGASLNACIPAEVIVGPLKEGQRCLVGNSMHLCEMGHGCPCRLIRREQFAPTLSAGDA